ncbi:MAG: DNA/RNA nuclease SfsA [Clostridia bacterium]|nr:DNA/RNA nuclease SfsA [Clostridia bacterium]
MQYKSVVQGTFVKRLNRFTAEVLLNGENILVHVKNTGRLKELLLQGALCGLCKAENPDRKTAYDLISVLHNGKWVNIDSFAPNTVACEFLKQSGLGEISLLKAEQFYTTADGNERSRFDFYAEFKDGRRAFIEVKGVTLVENGIAKFPDAPTTRGARHVTTLIDCVKRGFDAYVLFIIQRNDAHTFSPHEKQDLSFTQALQNAYRKDVKICAVDCNVDINTLSIRNFIAIKL